MVSMWIKTVKILEIISDVYLGVAKSVIKVARVQFPFIILKFVSRSSKTMKSFLAYKRTHLVLRNCKQKGEPSSSIDCSAYSTSSN